MTDPREVRLSKECGRCPLSLPGTESPEVTGLVMMLVTRTYKGLITPSRITA